MTGWVYPRACGGTLVVQGVAQSTAGLSPRVRGNHRAGGVPVVGVGSIPARAGEPLLCKGWLSQPPVYPRACGGTIVPVASRSSGSGLSPRVRGNPAAEPAFRPILGSIPARAGEPRRSWPTVTLLRVYPRACGGTSPASSPVPSRKGLSPRVRGNLNHPSGGRAELRSIPARAGEPTGTSASSSPEGVYPRACGGTRVRHSGEW